jgi:hypothetical protein
MEVADALAESECRPRVREFVRHLRGSAACEIVPASRELLDRALDLYHQHADKQWTLTDCVSFIIMRERGVSEALTGDKHFEQAGFVALLKWPRPPRLIWSLGQPNLTGVAHRRNLPRLPSCSFGERKLLKA